MVRRREDFSVAGRWGLSRYSALESLEADQISHYWPEMALCCADGGSRYAGDFVFF